MGSWVKGCFKEPPQTFRSVVTRLLVQEVLVEVIMRVGAPSALPGAGYTKGSAQTVLEKHEVCTANPILDSSVDPKLNPGNNRSRNPQPSHKP